MFLFLFSKLSLFMHIYSNEKVLYGINEYAFIPMVLFIIKNVYAEDRVFK